jgi:hypothetical protein
LLKSIRMVNQKGSGLMVKCFYHIFHSFKYTISHSLSLSLSLSLSHSHLHYHSLYLMLGSRTFISYELYSTRSSEVTDSEGKPKLRTVILCTKKEVHLSVILILTLTLTHSLLMNKFCFSICQNSYSCTLLQI